MGGGGYGALSLSSYQGDEDSYDINSSAVDSSGVGTASGAVSVTRAESSESQSNFDRMLNGQDVRSGTLDIKWNISALNSRLDSVSDQYDPVIRAKQLDRVVRKEAIKKVWRHNTADAFVDRTPIIKYFELGFDGLFLWALTREITEGDVGDVAISLGFRALVMAGFRTLEARRYGWDNLISDPLLWSTRPSRAIAATAVLASQRLVAAAE